MTCERVVEGCADCLAEAEYRGPHECNLLCSLFGEGKHRSEEVHLATHEPQRCLACRAMLDDYRSIKTYRVRLCWSRVCQQWYCPECETTATTAGPIDCPTCGWFVRPGRLRLMHSRYRRKKATW